MVPRILALVALVLAGCGEERASDGDAGVPPDTAHAPPLVGTRWRLHSLGGEAPVDGVEPVLIFAETPARRDGYDRPYPARFEGWRIVRGESGVGALHAPYRIGGDTLRFGDTYDYTRLSSAEEEAQARRLAEALAETRTFDRVRDRLVLVGAAHDTLATFTADPPRAPGPLDDIEWVLTEIGGAPVPDGTRATLTFTSRRLGPGPEDGFDAFGGYSGCNWYGGGYVLHAEGAGRYTLTTNGHVMSTERGCGSPAADVERMVYDALSRAARIRAETGERLVLLDSTGTELLAFRRHVPSPVDAGALRRGRWRLRMGPASGIGSDEPVEVTFADSTFEATAGCGRLHGAYRLDGDDLSVSTIESDRSRCTAAERNRPRPIPIGSGKLSVSADRLTLYDENGRPAVFTRPE